jgi:hypothetical protein
MSIVSGYNVRELSRRENSTGSGRHGLCFDTDAGLTTMESGTVSWSGDELTLSGTVRQLQPSHPLLTSHSIHPGNLHIGDPHDISVLSFEMQTCNTCSMDCVSECGP